MGLFDVQTAWSITSMVSKEPRRSRSFVASLWTRQRAGSVEAYGELIDREIAGIVITAHPTFGMDGTLPSSREVG